MNFRIVFSLFTLLLLTNKVRAQQPNILLIISDDIGLDATNGYYTNPIMPTTPTLDSLMRSGITFENAWAYPVCSPTRSSIMSAKYGVKTGVLNVPGNLDTSHTSLFKRLKELPGNPYSAAVIGKWHISQPANALHPQEHGLDYYTGYLSGAPMAYDNWQRTFEGVTQTDTGYVTSVFTDSAINWIGRQTKPWFLWLAHAAPHSPYHVPPSHLHTVTNTNGNIRKYLAMVEAMDTEIGRLLNSMTQAERDNTIIIYMGDNGTPSNIIRNYPSGRGKGSLYQGGISVPMFISGKGVSRIGERESALISVNDLHSTILELAGATLEGGINNSLSFKHLLDGSAGPAKPYNYIDYNQSGTNKWAIRNNRYKLIEDENGNQEFYDLLQDSFELNDKLMGSFTSQDSFVKADLEIEAAQIRSSWSCRDYIKNGDEEGIDCGGTHCAPCGPMSISRVKEPSWLTIYPNPTGSEISIELNGEIIESVQVFDLVGKQLFQQQFNTSDKVSLDLSNLKSNEYLVKIQTATQMFLRRVSKY